MGLVCFVSTFGEQVRLNFVLLTHHNRVVRGKLVDGAGEVIVLLAEGCVLVDGT